MTISTALRGLSIGMAMLVVETIGKIRREHFAQGKGARTIARELGLSRNTVRKVLRSGETSFDYERSEQPHRKLGLFIERLEAMLAANASAADVAVEP
jgi:predicted transcriptional regulator